MINEQTESDGEGPISDDGPLLPHWFCWTWPGTTLGWVFWSIGALSLGFGLFSSLWMLWICDEFVDFVGCFYFWDVLDFVERVGFCWFC